MSQTGDLNPREETSMVVRFSKSSKTTLQSVSLPTFAVEIAFVGTLSRREEAISGTATILSAGYLSWRSTHSDSQYRLSVRLHCPVRFAF